MSIEENDPGFKVTIKDVYLEVRDLRATLDSRLSRVESQIAAQWVVVGIVIVALGAVFARTLTS
jgi:hypothetical protein